MHNAAFRALGLDWVYLAFEVAPGRGRRGPRRHAGPRHRRAVGDDAPQGGRGRPRSTSCPPPPPPWARSTPSCVGADGRLRGENTDGAGFLAALADEGFDPAGRRCLVRGAGARPGPWCTPWPGPARPEVVVVPTATPDAGRGRRRPGRRRRAGWARPPRLAGADLVVNATPLGLDGGDRAWPSTPASSAPASWWSTSCQPGRPPPCWTAAVAGGRGRSTAWACSSTRAPWPSRCGPARAAHRRHAGRSRS